MRAFILSFVSMFAIVILLALLLNGCMVDRGQCLASHHEHEDGYTSYEYAPNGFGMSGGIAMGGTGSYRLVYHPDRDWDVCDAWEFPEGRPQK